MRQRLLCLLATIGLASAIPRYYNSEVTSCSNYEPVLPYPFDNRDYLPPLPGPIPENSRQEPHMLSIPDYYQHWTHIKEPRWQDKLYVEPQFHLNSVTELSYPKHYVTQYSDPESHSTSSLDYFLSRGLRVPLTNSPEKSVFSELDKTSSEVIAVSQTNPVPRPCLESSATMGATTSYVTTSSQSTEVKSSPSVNTYHVTVVRGPSKALNAEAYSSLGLDTLLIPLPNSDTRVLSESESASEAYLINKSRPRSCSETVLESSTSNAYASSTPLSSSYSQSASEYSTSDAYSGIIISPSSSNSKFSIDSSRYDSYPISYPKQKSYLESEADFASRSELYPGPSSVSWHRSETRLPYSNIYPLPLETEAGYSSSSYSILDPHVCPCHSKIFPFPSSQSMSEIISDMSSRALPTPYSLPSTSGAFLELEDFPYAESDSMSNFYFNSGSHMSPGYVPDPRERSWFNVFVPTSEIFANAQEDFSSEMHFVPQSAGFVPNPYERQWPYRFLPGSRSVSEVISNEREDISSEIHVAPQSYAASDSITDFYLNSDIHANSELIQNPYSRQWSYGILPDSRPISKVIASTNEDFYSEMHSVPQLFHPCGRSNSISDFHFNSGTHTIPGFVPDPRENPWLNGFVPTSEIFTNTEEDFSSAMHFIPHTSRPWSYETPSGPSQISELFTNAREDFSSEIHFIPQNPGFVPNSYERQWPYRFLPGSRSISEVISNEREDISSEIHVAPQSYAASNSITDFYLNSDIYANSGLVQNPYIRKWSYEILPDSKSISEIIASTNEDFYTEMDSVPQLFNPCGRSDSISDFYINSGTHMSPGFVPDPRERPWLNGFVPTSEIFTNTEEDFSSAMHFIPQTPRQWSHGIPSGSSHISGLFENEKEDFSSEMFLTPPSLLNPYAELDSTSDFYFNSGTHSNPGFVQYPYSRQWSCGINSVPGAISEVYENAKEDFSSEMYLTPQPLLNPYSESDSITNIYFNSGTHLSPGLVTDTSQRTWRHDFVPTSDTFANAQEDFFSETHFIPQSSGFVLNPCERQWPYRFPPGSRSISEVISNEREDISSEIHIAPQSLPNSYVASDSISDFYLNSDIYANSGFIQNPHIRQWPYGILPNSRSISEVIASTNEDFYTEMDSLSQLFNPYGRSDSISDFYFNSGTHTSPEFAPDPSVKSCLQGFAPTPEIFTNAREDFSSEMHFMPGNPGFVPNPYEKQWPHKESDSILDFYTKHKIVTNPGFVPSSYNRPNGILSRPTSEVFASTTEDFNSEIHSMPYSSLDPSVYSNPGFVPRQWQYGTNQVPGPLPEIFANSMEDFSSELHSIVNPNSFGKSDSILDIYTKFGTHSSPGFVPNPYIRPYRCLPGSRPISEVIENKSEDFTSEVQSTTHSIINPFINPLSDPYSRQWPYEINSSPGYMSEIFANSNEDFSSEKHSIPHSRFNPNSCTGSVLDLYSNHGTFTDQSLISNPCSRQWPYGINSFPGPVTESFANARDDLFSEVYSTPNSLIHSSSSTSFVPNPFQPHRVSSDPGPISEVFSTASEDFSSEMHTTPRFLDNLISNTGSNSMLDLYFDSRMQSNPGFIPSPCTRQWPCGIHHSLGSISEVITNTKENDFVFEYNSTPDPFFIPRSCAETSKLDSSVISLSVPISEIPLLPFSEAIIAIVDSPCVIPLSNPYVENNAVSNFNSYYHVPGSISEVIETAREDFSSETLSVPNPSKCSCSRSEPRLDVISDSERYINPSRQIPFSCQNVDPYTTHVETSRSVYPNILQVEEKVTSPFFPLLGPCSEANGDSSSRSYYFSGVNADSSKSTQYPGSNNYYYFPDSTSEYRRRYSLFPDIARTSQVPHYITPQVSNYIFPDSRLPGPIPFPDSRYISTGPGSNPNPNSRLPGPIPRTAQGPIPDSGPIPGPIPDTPIFYAQSP